MTTDEFRGLAARIRFTTDQQGLGRMLIRNLPTVLAALDAASGKSTWKPLDTIRTLVEPEDAGS